MKKLFVLLLSAMLILAQPLSVLAAPITLPDGSVFDPEFYAQQNPDVVAVLGTDPAALYNHYLTAGKAEGRLPYAGYVSPTAFLATLAQRKIDVFTAYRYRNSSIRVLEDSRYYQDPVNNREYHEYVEYGVYSCRYSSIGYYQSERANEYKDESYFFDHARYARDYPAVAAAVGTSKEALWNHFKTQGVYQGLRAYSTSSYGNAKLVALYELPGIVANATTQREQIKAVHNWMIGTMDYDMENFLQDTVPDYSYHLTGALVAHTAVCNGYAETFDYFMSLLGIEADIASGQANGYGGWGGHAWNRVVVDGQVLFVDVTWDDDCWTKGSAIPSYDYFMISEQQILRDHFIEEYKNPY